MFPVEFSITIRLYGRNGHFVADIIDASKVISDGQADQVCTWCCIGVVWSRSIAFMTITKVPVVGNNIMFTRRSAVEMDLQRPGQLLPGKLSIALSLDGLGNHRQQEERDKK